MIDYILNTYYTLSVQDKVLFLLIISIILLIILAVIFSIITVILRVKNIIIANRWKRLEKKFKDKIIKVLYDAEPRHEFINNIKSYEKTMLIEYLFRFAIRITGEEHEKIKLLTEPYLPIIAKKYKKSNAEFRAYYLKILAVLGFEKYSDLIVESLNDPSLIVAMVAARSLASPEKSEYFEKLIAKIDRFKNWNYEYLTSMIINMGLSVCEHLRDILNNKNLSIFTRIAAVESLRRLNDANSSDIACRIIEEEKDRELLSSCLRLLRETGIKKHRTTVIKLVDSDDSILRVNALKTLIEICNDTDADIFMKYVNDPSPWVSFYAMQGLKKMGRQDLLNEIAISDSPQSQTALEILQGEYY